MVSLLKKGCARLLGSALLFGIICLWYISGCRALANFAKARHPGPCLGKSSTINHTLILLIKTKSKTCAEHGLEPIVLILKMSDN